MIGQNIKGKKKSLNRRVIIYGCKNIGKDLRVNIYFSKYTGP